MPRWVQAFIVLTTVPTWMATIFAVLARGGTPSPELVGSLGVVLGTIGGIDFVINMSRKKTDGADEDR